MNIHDKVADIHHPEGITLNDGVENLREHSSGDVFQIGLWVAATKQFIVEDINGQDTVLDIGQTGKMISMYTWETFTSILKAWTILVYWSQKSRHDF